MNAKQWYHAEYMGILPKNEAMLWSPLKNFTPLPIPSHNHAPFPLPSPNQPSISKTTKHRAPRSQITDSQSQSRDGEDTTPYKVITAVSSIYNDIVIVDTPKSRMLLLDQTHNVHSIIHKDYDREEDKFWSGSYWDEFATLPPILPDGPIAVLGLGAGTAARLILHLYPSLRLHGWEIDDLLIRKARDHFDLSDLEAENESGGVLNIHIGDALSPTGTYAGIVVDLFSGGRVLPEMEEVGTWVRWKERLVGNGRIMVNCGGSDGGSGMVGDDEEGRKMNSAIGAMTEGFGGECLWKRMAVERGGNYLALTGPLPDLDSWSALLHPRLSSNVYQWRPCD